MMQTIFSAICEKNGKGILENVLFLPFFPTLDFPNLIWIMLLALRNKEAPDKYSRNGACNDLNSNELTDYRKLVGSN